MISKIKDLLQTKELIDEIIEKTRQNTEAVAAMQSEISAVKGSLNSLRQREVELLSGLEKDVKEIAVLKEDFKRELYEFNLFKVETQKKILEKYDKELERELLHHLDTLQGDARQYNDIRIKIASIMKNIDELSQEAAKLTGVSKKINEGDFELAKFANVLRQNDRERLSLLEKIDRLERLVAKSRRPRQAGQCRYQA